MAENEMIEMLEDDESMMKRRGRGCDGYIVKRGRLVLNSIATAEKYAVDNRNLAVMNQ
jgi:hypothetical protein